MIRKTYDRQFKIASVKMILEDGIPVRVVSEELDVHLNIIYQWLTEYKNMVKMFYWDMKANCTHISLKLKNCKRK